MLFRSADAGIRKSNVNGPPVGEYEEMYEDINALLDAAFTSLRDDSAVVDFSALDPYSLGAAHALRERARRSEGEQEPPGGGDAPRMASVPREKADAARRKYTNSLKAMRVQEQ